MHTCRVGFEGVEIQVKRIQISNNLQFKLLSQMEGSHTYDILEILDTLVHDFECTVDIGGQQLGVNVDEGVIHPGLVPLEPVSSSQPQVLKWLKVSTQLTNLVILQNVNINL